MVLINFLFFISNVLLLIFGFLFIRKKIEKLVVNKEILTEIKKEINSMIIRLNETTVTNINLVEEKARILEKLIKFADRKAGGLETKIMEINDSPEKFNLTAGIQTYNPQKIIKQSTDTTEKIYKQDFIRNEEFRKMEDEIGDLPINEKVRLMLNEGFTSEEIKRKFGLSTGEFELILNLES
jgi:hypothetical protein